MSINVLRRKRTVRHRVIQTLADPAWKSKPSRGGQCSGGVSIHYIILLRHVFYMYCQACGSNIQAPGKLEGNCRRSEGAQCLRPEWAGPNTYQKRSQKQDSFWMQMFPRVLRSESCSNHDAILISQCIIAMMSVSISWLVF